MQTYQHRTVGTPVSDQCQHRRIGRHALLLHHQRTVHPFLTAPHRFHPVFSRRMQTVKSHRQTPSLQIRHFFIHPTGTFLLQHILHIILRPVDGDDHAAISSAIQRIASNIKLLQPVINTEITRQLPFAAVDHILHLHKISSNLTIRSHIDLLPVGRRNLLFQQSLYPGTVPPQFIMVILRRHHRHQ